MKRKKPWQQRTGEKKDLRLEAVRTVFLVFGVLIGLKLFVIQVIEHENYSALANGQHEIFQKLYPRRGKVFVHDKDTLVPVATNQQVGFVYADPRYVKDANAAVDTLSTFLTISDEKKATLKTRLSDQKDPYEPIEHDVPKSITDKLIAEKIPGILVTMETARLYPEANMGGQLLGFIGADQDGAQKGRYGIEGFFDEQLAGTQGFLKSDKDIAGNLIAIADRSLTPAQDGADIVLTIDRTIQYKACSLLAARVKQHSADGGSIVVVDPKTGRILAMCGSPDFDPNQFRSVSNINTFNNPVIFDAYEPGSIFKTITLAAALDAGAVAPTTVFHDAGSIMVQGWPKPIGNALGKKYGDVDMTKVLEKSINTGMVFIMRQMGVETFQEYVKKFGFGELTGVSLKTEMPGNLRQLFLKTEIYHANAAFGQGITVTPLQMAMAYAALANGGTLKKPLIVDEIRRADGTVEKFAPQDVRQVVSAKTARTVGAMLVNVVEHGEGHAAGVSGYYIGGKTGTAQVAKGGVYEENNTIGSFAGFGPVEDPRFAMVVRINRPRDVEWAESTAAPLFGEMAKFLLQYLEIPPTRK